jgi:hypothetical protein
MRILPHSEVFGFKVSSALHASINDLLSVIESANVPLGDD